MSFPCWLQNLQNVFASRQGPRRHRRRGLLRAAPLAASLEILEDRIVPSFVEAGLFPVGFGSQVLGTTDFNNDGHLDLTTGTSVLLGDGRGGFGAAFDATVEQSMINFNSLYIDGMAFGDCTSDGIPDRITANSANSNVWRLFVEPGRGDGTFGDAIGTEGAFFPLDSPWGLWAAADFNGDGQLDVITTSFNFELGGLRTKT